VSAYNPPLAETDAASSPPRYDNSGKQALTFFTWAGLVGGALLMAIAIAITTGAEGDLEQLQAAALAQQVSVFLLIIGAIALFALLAARSVTYDLMYRFGPRPDYRPAVSVDEAEHFTAEGQR